MLIEHRPMLWSEGRLQVLMFARVCSMSCVPVTDERNSCMAIGAVHSISARAGLLAVARTYVRMRDYLACYPR